VNNERRCNCCGDVEHKQSVLRRIQKKQYPRQSGMISRAIDPEELSERFTRHQHQPWIHPPFYRFFWFLHNISLISTPVSFGMFLTKIYEGKSLVAEAVIMGIDHAFCLSVCLSVPYEPLFRKQKGSKNQNWREHSAAMA